MLMRRTIASVQLHMQVVLVCLQQFRRSSLFPSVSPTEIAQKFIKTAYLWILKSFKVIDVGTPGKFVSSVYYEKQQVFMCSRSRARLVDSGRNCAV